MQSRNSEPYRVACALQRGARHRGAPASNGLWRESRASGPSCEPLLPFSGRSELNKLIDYINKGIEDNNWLSNQFKNKDFEISRNTQFLNIETKISTKFSDINEKYLVKLGSLGLFNRLRILKNIEEPFD